MTWPSLGSWWRRRASARPSSAAPQANSEDFHCPALSRLIRAACAERDASVWWVVVVGSDAAVYVEPTPSKPAK